MKISIFTILAAFVSLSVNAGVIGTASNLFKPAEGGVYERTSSYTLSVNGEDVPVLDGGNSQTKIDYDVARFTAPAGLKTTARITSASDITSISVHPVMLGITPVKIDDRTYEFEIPDPDAIRHYIFVKINGRDLVLTRDVPEDVPSGEGVFNVGEALAKKNVDPSSKKNVSLVTSTFQNLIDKASAYGTSERRGVVYVPSGVYYLGNIIVKSNVELFISQGALLHATDRAADYSVNYHKNSLDTDGTWWISTANEPNDRSENVYIHGLGTLDANGSYWDPLIKKRNKSGFAITALHIIHARNVTVDGLTVLQTPMWGTMIGRSEDVNLTNMKFLNMKWGAENDGIDVMESRRVKIDRAIGVCLDDPFSTKTWMGQELFAKWKGEPEPLEDVTFDNCVSWTYCGAFKLGHGAQQLQKNVKVLNGVVLNSGRAIGIEPKYVNDTPIGGFRDVLFENIDIEHSSGEGWLKMIAETPGAGYPPIGNVTLRNINIRQKGDPSTLRGTNDEFFIDGVTFDNITLNGNPEPVGTLAELNITKTGFYKNVRFVQDASHDTDHLIEAENWNSKETGTTVDNNGNDAGHPHGQYLSAIQADKQIIYRSVDFGSSAKSIILRVRNDRSSFKAIVRIDSPSGEIVAEGPVAKSSGWNNIELPLESVSGIHDLYLSFEKTTGPSNQVTGLNYLIICGRKVNDLISLSPAENNIEVNIYTSLQLPVKYTPEDAYQRDLTWEITSQTPADAVTLSREGVVTANKPGTAVITATSLWNPDIHATFNITTVDKQKFTTMRIEAESADEIFSPYHYDAAMSKGKVNDPEEPGAEGLNSLWDTNFAVYNDINFGEGAVKAIIRKGYVRGSAMEIWIDPEIDRTSQKISGGTKIAEIEYPAISDDWSRWATFETPVSGETAGTHNLVLYFKQGGGSGHERNYGALNWLDFLIREPAGSGVSGTYDDDMILNADGSSITITTKSPKPFALYSLDGRTVSSGMLAAGVNHIGNLDKGIYILNGNKIAIF